MKSSLAVIPNGGQYAKVRKPYAKELRGAELLTYKVTKRLTSISGNPRWELQCKQCGATRPAMGSSIVGQALGTHHIRACGCVTGRIFNTQRCQEVMNLSAPDVEVLCYVMAYQRVKEGAAPLRLHLKKTMKRDPRVARLVRSHYLEEFGTPMRLRATAKTWREFGFSQDERFTDPNATNEEA